MYNKILMYIKENKIKVLFLCFFLFYFILGILLSYNYKMVERWDFLFEADIPRVIADSSEIYGNHYRISVHPLFVILVQPIVLMLQGITHNNILAILLFQSIIGGLKVVILYKFLYLINKNSKLSIIISILFGVSFSSIIFTAGIELYSLASFSMLTLWYLVALYLKKQINTKLFYTIYILFGILCIGITITNYVVFLISNFILIISKKVKLKKIIMINAIVLVSFFSLNIIQHFVWNNVPTILNKEIANESTQNWVSFDINKQKIKNVISDNYYNSILASNVECYKTETGVPIIRFQATSAFNIIFMTILYLTILFYFIKNFKKQKLLNIGIILSLLFNTIFHLIYGNYSPFLYSEHFVYLFFLMIGINIDNKNKKSRTIIYILILIIITIFIKNIIIFRNILDIVKIYFTNEYYSQFPIYLTLAIYLSFSIVLILIKKLLKIILKKIDIPQKYWTLIITIIMLFITSCFFVGIDTAKMYQKIFGLNLSLYKK